MQTLDRMPAVKTTACRRIRLALLVLSCTALPALCWATRRVPVFLVDVSNQSTPALQQAMRAALVRATGRPESATDPVFATLVAQAPKYVVNYQRGPQGELEVAFNGAEVDQVITRLGRSIWSADRPFTLIVLSPMPDQADYEADHAALEQAAQTRGLPISIVPLPVTGASGQLLPPQALLALVHRFGAEQLLVGEPLAAAAPGQTAPGGSGAPLAPQIPGDGAAARNALPVAAPGGGPSSPGILSGGAALHASPAVPSQLPGAGAGAQTGASAPATLQWQWTLITPFMRREFTGSLTAGIDRTVDLLAPPLISSGNRRSGARVRIEGVSTLQDYAHIELMLAAMPGVRRANVSTVHGNTVVFTLQALGGAATVARMLSGSPHFSRAPASGGALVYRYLPQTAAAAPAATPAAH